jgi:hypothetical protein
VGQAGIFIRAKVIINAMLTSIINDKIMGVYKIQVKVNISFNIYKFKQIWFG